MNKYFKLAKFQLRKKSNIIMAIIVSIAIIVIIATSSYKKSVKYFNDYAKTTYISYSQIYVYNDQKTSYKEYHQTLENIKHVKYVFDMYEFNEFIYADIFKNAKSTGGVHIYNSNNDSLPKIVKGTNFPDNDAYYMVCPINFYSYASSSVTEYTNNDKFDLTSYLGKEIIFNYEADLYWQNLLDKYKFSIPIKLVGLYENNPYVYDENECYVNQKTIHDIVKNKYKDQETNYEIQLKYTNFVLTIDNYDNLDSVTKTLDNLGYKYGTIMISSPENLIKLYNVTNLVCCITIAIMSLFIFLLFQKDYHEDKEYFKQLYLLGYNEKEIRKVYLFSLIIKTCIYLLTNIIMTILALIIYKIILFYRPYILLKQVILYDFKIYFLVILILGLNIFVNLFLHRKIGKIEND